MDAPNITEPVTQFPASQQKDLVLMPRYKTPSIQEYAITAAGREPVEAEGGSLNILGSSRTNRSDLQEKAWAFYDRVGEVSYVADSIIGTRIGQLTWFPAWRESGSPYPKAINFDNLSEEIINESDKEIINDIVASMGTLSGGPQDFY